MKIKICKCRTAGDNAWCPIHGKAAGFINRFKFKMLLRAAALRMAARNIKWLEIVVVVNTCASIAMFLMIVDLYKMNNDFGAALDFMAKVVGHVAKKVGMFP